MTVKTRFSELLKKKSELLKKDITYREVAEDAGLSVRTVWLLYQGKGNQFKIIEKLCRYFDCTIDELLELK